jgi:hypothetical protein
VRPDLTKTAICPEWRRGRRCPLESSTCPFAHGASELKATVLYRKTVLCAAYTRGNCKMGNRCRHAHGIEEICNSDQGLGDPIRACKVEPHSFHNAGGRFSSSHWETSSTAATSTDSQEQGIPSSTGTVSRSAPAGGSAAVPSRAGGQPTALTDEFLSSTPWGRSSTPATSTDSQELGIPWSTGTVSRFAPAGGSAPVPSRAGGWSSPPTGERLSSSRFGTSSTPATSIDSQELGIPWSTGTESRFAPAAGSAVVPSRAGGRPSDVNVSRFAPAGGSAAVPSRAGGGSGPVGPVFVAPPQRPRLGSNTNGNGHFGGEEPGQMLLSARPYHDEELGIPSPTGTKARFAPVGGSAAVPSRACGQPAVAGPVFVVPPRRYRNNDCNGADRIGGDECAAMLLRAMPDHYDD